MPGGAVGHSQALESCGAERAAPVPGLDFTLQHLLASDLGLSYFVYKWTRLYLSLGVAGE